MNSPSRECVWSSGPHWISLISAELDAHNYEKGALLGALCLYQSLLKRLCLEQHKDVSKGVVDPDTDEDHTCCVSCPFLEHRQPIEGTTE